jgi:hypothetical protein
MITRKVLIVSVGVVLSAFIVSAEAELSKEQLYTLFNQANEAFRQANSIAGQERADKLYEKAILCYEKIINEGKIENAKLYYNLANAYLLKENIGKAILYYRRAAKLDGSDTNIRKNLEFARSQRIDKITTKTEKRVMQTLFFWHYDFSLRTKFVLTCLLFAAFCIILTVTIWFGRSAPATLSAVIVGILIPCLLISVVIEARQATNAVCGVITAPDVIARQGDGQNYPPSFKDPLHGGSAFDLLERRPGWFHLRLSDDSDAWIPQTAAELI